MSCRFTRDLFCRQVFIESTRFVLAWGLFDVRMLWMSTGRGWIHIVHQSEYDLVQKGLFQVCNGECFVHRTMLLLIDRFYRMFGNKGMCAACFKDIPAFEMVMRARSNVYHLECFACQQCNHRYMIYYNIVLFPLLLLLYNWVNCSRVEIG